MTGKEKLTHVLETTDQYDTAKNAIYEYCHTCEDDRMPFDSVTKLTQSAAKALVFAITGKEGDCPWNTGELWLDNLTDLPERVARKLAKAKTRTLSFSSLTHLSDQVAKILASSWCDELYLPRAVMSEKGLNSMVKFRGSQALFIPSWTSVDTLKALGGDHLDLQFENTISVNVAQVLINSAQILNLSFKDELPLDAAKELTKHLAISRSGRILNVSGPMPTEAREILRNAGACLN
jgi:hypothetical protein